MIFLGIGSFVCFNWKINCFLMRFGNKCYKVFKVWNYLYKGNFKLKIKINWKWKFVFL